MVQHREAFLSKADRERILQQILKGDLPEPKATETPQATIAQEISEPRNQQLTHMTSHMSGHMTEASVGGATTIKELERILVTAAVLVLLLIGLAFIQSKTPYINELSAKLGSSLSI